MKIGVAQIDCEAGNVAGNLRTLKAWVQQAASADCDVVVLPEMADTGYVMRDILAHASVWDDGPCKTLRELAADLGIAVICGLSEREHSHVYNAAAVIDKDGTLVDKYRKAHLISMAPVHEDRHLAPGDALTLTKLGGFKIGVMICYDIRFPEMARALVLGGAEVLVVVAAWPTVRAEAWRVLTAARAMENQVYVAAANRVGKDGQISFCGDSCLLDPVGLPLASASGTEQTLLTGEITRDRIAEVRSSMRVFDDRRPDLYRSPT